jgi:hypothetical protein
LTLGSRVITPIGEGGRAYALDPKAAEALWKKSEELGGREILRRARSQWPE